MIRLISSILFWFLFFLSTSQLAYSQCPGPGCPAQSVFPGAVFGNLLGSMIVLNAVENSNSIFQDISKNRDARFFSSAVASNEIDSKLLNVKKFTIFVPTDNAFSAISRSLMDKLQQPSNKKLLSKILLCNIAIEQLTIDKAIEVATTRSQNININTLGGCKLKFGIVEDKMFIYDDYGNRAKVMSSKKYDDISAMYIIDGVIGIDHKYL